MRVLGNGMSGAERYAGSEGQDSGGQKWVLPLLAPLCLGTWSITNMTSQLVVAVVTHLIETA